MGGRFSVIPEPDGGQDEQYFALALREPDRILLVQAADDAVRLVQRCVLGDPQSGDDLLRKEQRRDDNCYELQLRGGPFSKYEPRASALRVKRLLCQLIGELYAYGWEVAVASELTTDDYHTTWFFRRALDVERVKRRIVGLSLSGSDGLILVNAPARLRKALKFAVRCGYAYGAESEDCFDDDLEVKLNGQPWETAMFEEGVWARKLLLEIFRQFAKCRYFYYAVADTKGTADSIFFVHHQPPIEVRRGSSLKTVAAGPVETTGQSLKTFLSQTAVVVQSETLQNPDQSRQHPNDIAIAAIARKFDFTNENTLSVDRIVRRNSWQEPSSPYPQQTEQFMMISLNRTDSLRFVDAPPAVLELCKRLVVEHWPHGLEKEIRHDLANELRLNNSPWSAVGGDAVAAQSFLTILFEELSGIGWCLLAAVDMSRRKNDKSVFVLRRETVPERRRHFCLSMCDGDKLRVVRGDQSVVDVVRRCLPSWPYGLQKEREYFGAYEFQLVGYPWLSLPGNGNEPLSARAMLIVLLREFYANNWRVLASADVSCRRQSPTNMVYRPVDVDCWIVARND